MEHTTIDYKRLNGIEIDSIQRALANFDVMVTTPTSHTECNVCIYLGLNDIKYSCFDVCVVANRCKKYVLAVRELNFYLRNFHLGVEFPDEAIEILEGLLNEMRGGF